MVNADFCNAAKYRKRGMIMGALILQFDAKAKEKGANISSLEKCGRDVGALLRHREHLADKIPGTEKDEIQKYIRASFTVEIFHEKHDRDIIMITREYVAECIAVLLFNPDSYRDAFHFFENNIPPQGKFAYKRIGDVALLFSIFFYKRSEKNRESMKYYESLVKTMHGSFRSSFRWRPEDDDLPTVFRNINDHFELIARLAHKALFQ